MKYLQTYNIFEKSSLTALGVPNEVMKHIQYNYEINSNANWERIKLKRDLDLELRKSEKILFVEIAIGYIKIFINLGTDEYLEQKYQYNKSDWGGYDIFERKIKSRTKLLVGINSKHLIYKLDGDFQWRPKAQRVVQKKMKKFDEETNDFKFYILYHFNNIIKRLYGVRYEGVMKKIASNIKKLSEDATADEILEFLKDNKKMAEKAKEYEMAKNDEDLLRIKNLEKQFNSLPIIDEYLLKFEEGYSKKYHNRLSIKDLIDDFGRMKIETAFMFFLFTGKLKDLTIQRKK